MSLLQFKLVPLVPLVSLTYLNLINLVNSSAIDDYPN